MKLREILSLYHAVKIYTLNAHILVVFKHTKKFYFSASVKLINYENPTENCYCFVNIEI